MTDESNSNLWKRPRAPGVQLPVLRQVRATPSLPHAHVGGFYALKWAGLGVARPAVGDG